MLKHMEQLLQKYKTYREIFTARYYGTCPKRETPVPRELT